MEDEKDINLMTPQKFNYDLAALSVALQIDTKTCQDAFTDGRALSAVFTPAINALLNLTPKWRVRIVTNGIDVSPSVDRGEGRKFNPVTFLPDLLTLDGILAADAWGFPNVDYWAIPVPFFVKLWNDSVISHKTGHLGRKTFLQAVQLYNP